MKLLGLSQLRFLLLTPWSTFTVFTGIALGITSVVAVHQISARIDQSLEAVVPAHLRNVSFLLEKSNLTATDYFLLRRDWRAGKYPAIRSLVPVVEGELLSDDRQINVIGVDGLAGLSYSSAADSQSAGAEMAGLFAPRTIALSTSLGLASGETFTTAGIDYRVVATVDEPLGTVMFADIGTAQELLGMHAEELSRIAVVIAQPWADVRQILDKLLPGFSAGFPRRAWVLDGWQVTSLDTELPSLVFARSVLFNLGALGSLALVVSWLLVYQVGVIWLRRRRQTMERLSLLGVSIVELRGGFLLSLLALGIAATATGIVAGHYLAQLLSAVSTAGLDVNDDPPGLERWVVLKAVLSGTGVSLLGGWFAFRQEWVRKPMQNKVLRTSRNVFVVCLLGGLGIAGVVFVEELWGGFLSILVAALATVGVMRPLLERLNRYARAPGNQHLLRFSLLARVGLRELAWYPRDLSVAIGALALAVSASIAIGLMVDSFRADFTKMLEQRLAHDLFVRSGSQLTATSTISEVAEWLGDQSTVTAVQAYGRHRMRLQGRLIELGYTEFSAREAGRYGVAGALAPGDALLSERLARDLGVATNDSIVLEATVLRIRGVFPGFGDLQPRLLVDSATADGLGIPVRYDRLSVATSDAEYVTRALLERYPQLAVQQRAVMRRSALQIFDRTFAITQALTLVALAVASIGLYNALLGLKLNQGPTLELLRSMGVSEEERRSVQLWRAVGVGTTVLLVALPAGVVMAWLLCDVINPRAFGWSLNLSLSAGAILPPLLTGVLAIVVTSLLPTPHERLSEIGEGV